MDATTEPKSKPAGQSQLGYRQLFARYVGPQRAKAALMAMLLLASIGLELIVPQVLRRFIDGIVAAAGSEALVPLALLFLAAALLRQLLGAIATVTAADVSWTATNLVREDLLGHAVELDMSFHNGTTAGEMIERIDGDVTALSNFFSQFAVRVLGGLLLLVGILVVLWLTNPLLGAALTLFTALQLAVLSRTRRLGVPATVLEREASARHFGFIEERLAGIEDLRGNGGGAHALHRFNANMRTYFFDTRRAWILQSVVWLSSYGLFVIGSAVTLGGSILLLRAGTITIGTAYMVFQYLLMLQTPIEQISQQLQELQKAAASIGRIGDLLAVRSRLPAGSGRSLPTGPLEVAFDDVSFAYGERPVLQAIDVRLAPGRVLGILGRTGSGKSTLVRLLFRLYDPTAGAVRLSGVDTRDADLLELRRRVGMVTQEVQLFQGTLRDNITLFDPTIDDARVLTVLEQLGLSDWLATLPAGLDTIIETGGGNLSAGEGQLLAFARIFLEDPGLVILDEPSSRLDPATEARLERAVERLLRGRTGIIIAHRLETLERADEVLVLGDGRLLEWGPRAKLAATPGSLYARLRAAGRDLDLDGEGANPLALAGPSPAGETADQPTQEPRS